MVSLKTQTTKFNGLLPPLPKPKRPRRSPPYSPRSPHQGYNMINQPHLYYIFAPLILRSSVPASLPQSAINPTSSNSGDQSRATPQQAAALSNSLGHLQGRRILSDLIQRLQAQNAGGNNASTPPGTSPFLPALSTRISFNETKLPRARVI